MLNDEQSANLEAEGVALNNALRSAWTYFYLLRGFHRGSSKHPKALARCPEALTELWRALFWALVSTTGTIVDRTRNTHSLPTVLKMIRKYFGAKSDMGELTTEISARLQAEDGLFPKLEAWRHSVVAHNSREGEQVFETSKMDLAEFEQLLDQLTAIVDEAIWNSLAVAYTHIKESAQEYEQHGELIFDRIAA